MISTKNSLKKWQKQQAFPKALNVYLISSIQIFTYVFKYFEVKVKKKCGTLLSRSDQVNLIVSLELLRDQEASGFLRALMLDVPVWLHLWIIFSQPAPRVLSGVIQPGAERLFLSASIIVASEVLLSIQPSCTRL